MRTTRNRLAQHNPQPDTLKRIEVAAAHVDQTAQPTGPNPEEREKSLDTSTAPETRDIPNDAEELVERVNDWPEDWFGDADNQLYDGAIGRVLDGGFDCVAFYKSFRDVHRPPARGRWGIFFIKTRCIAVAKTMALDTGESFSNSLEALVELLYAHELYHYKVDAHCLQIESTGGPLLYRPYRNLVRQRPMDEWHEESIANRYGLAALNRKDAMHLPDSLRQFLYQLVAMSPGAYAGGILARQGQRKDAMSAQAASSFGSHPHSQPVQQLVYSTIRSGANLDRPNDKTLGPLMRLENCPVYWIDWIRRGNTTILPLTVSVREIRKDFVERYLNGHLDHRSDHEYYRIDNGELVKLPNLHDKDIRDYELKNIAGKAGMTILEYEVARRKTLGWKKNVPRQAILPPRAVFSHESKR